jgi:hypothetical protein
MFISWYVQNYSEHLNQKEKLGKGKFGHAKIQATNKNEEKYD